MLPTMCRCVNKVWHIQDDSPCHENSKNTIYKIISVPMKLYKNVILYLQSSFLTLGFGNGYPYQFKKFKNAPNFMKLIINSADESFDFGISKMISKNCCRSYGNRKMCKT